MPSDSRVRVWCEDRAHEQFVRRLLIDVFHVPGRNLRFNTAPAGKGAASKWVEEQYLNVVVPEHRRASHQRGLGFLILIDGDNKGVSGRLAGIPARTGTDRISIMVPTWSIETWTLWLLGEDVDETASLKHRLPEQDFGERIGTAVANWHATATRDLSKVPSLERGREELKRLPL